MKKPPKYLHEFVIDKLTNSIENVISGDSFPTDILLVKKEGLIGINGKKGWQFNWELELKQPDRDVYKLTIVYNPAAIHFGGHLMIINTLSALKLTDKYF